MRTDRIRITFYIIGSRVKFFILIGGGGLLIHKNKFDKKCSNEFNEMWVIYSNTLAKDIGFTWYCLQETMCGCGNMRSEAKARHVK